MHTLSPDQKKALSELLIWYRKDRNAMQYVTLGGYAGTGKTTLISVLRKELDKIDKKIRIGFVSYTGKAARVLQNRLKVEKSVYRNDTVSTIHSLIYSPIVNDQKIIIGWKQKESIDRNLIVIDEASMVDGLIWEHLLSYHVPIIAVGDHGQLPPISGNFNLMAKPNLIIEKIHRQAEHNPIIALSMQARLTGEIRVGKYSPTVIKYNSRDNESQETVGQMLSNYNNDTLILTGYNTTRKKINAYVRNSLGFESPYPQNGDRVICLRNNHIKNIFNGMLGSIKQISQKDKTWYSADIEMDGEDEVFSGLISKDQFFSDGAMNFTDRRKDTIKGDLFDFGYALTVHKAQGSQAKRVILIEERFKKMNDEEWRRWLYTAVTRAEEELYIFSG